MSTMSTEIAMDEPPKSFLQRLVGVFVSPGATFADVARKPDFIAPLIVSILATMAVFETMLGRIGAERIVRQSLEQSGRASNMSPEQLQQALEQGAKFTGIFMHVTGLLASPIVLLVVAGLGLLIMNAIFGSRLKFKTAFSVTCYANLVSVLGAIIALVMILLADPDQFNAQNPMPTNPGFFFNPRETSKPLLSLLGSLDVFSIWLIVLLGTGFSEAVSRKVKPTTISLCFAGLWVVWVLFKMGLAMLG
jgi:Yip1 domain